ncbi:WecA-like glycosyltransferase [Anatilimnocola aggregata]|uniref:WecA-like glycosyltransferase n=1 Tax=Anatilimnocola aggregata TaxID=2528021 RepID=A0A517YGP5_9BACT|nr:MraY family glycosyltransferase [Anatilimnocola aggregata]QDU29388.1 WecA-like glycosyltransferase [Anatilimnocola aggregata]
MTFRQTLFFLLGSVIPALALALIGTRLMRWLSPRWGLVDHPAARKVHVTPTPLGGGIGIWLGVVGTFAAGQLALTLIGANSSWQELVPDFARPHLAGIHAQMLKLWILLLAGTVLMLLGLSDDRWGLSWQVRMATQFAVAAACVYFIPNLRLTVFIDQPWFTGMLSVLWIVALINSFNMLDNMDGLSGGIATIAAGFLAAVMLIAPNPDSPGPQLFVAGFLLVLTGSLLGFLWHNRPPAKIFMGDAGSYFVGFNIAVATLLASYTGYHGETRHAILAPLCVMAVPLYDLVTVLAIRIRAGQSIFAADKNHFSHRLVELGLTKPQAVLTVYLTTAMCGLAAVLLHRVDTLGAVLLMMIVGCTLSLIAILETTARRKIKQP